MTTNKTVLSIALGSLLVAGALYTYAYTLKKEFSPSGQATAAHGKTAAADVADGSYVATIHSVRTSPEDTVFTFDHVIYFEGAEATSSATHDVRCPNQPLAACVPTLTLGYYVRPSGTSEFTVPVTSETKVSLKDVNDSSVAAVKELSRRLQPVFDVVIENGIAVSITEKSPI